MDQGQCTPLAVVPTGAVPVVATGAVPVVANTPHYTIDERAAIYESMRNLYH